MTTKNRGFRSLVGGGLGALDSYVVAGITDEDAAFGIVNGLHHSYFYDASLVIAANNSPYQIIPADNGTGTGAWVLSGFQGAISHVDVYESTGQSIPNATSTTIVFDTEIADLLGEFNATTGIFTATYTGRYLVSTQSQYVSAAWSAGEIVRLFITTDGDTILKRSIMDRLFSGTNSTGVAVTSVVSLTAGDTLYIQAYQSQGGAVSLDSASGYNFLTIDRMV